MGVLNLHLIPTSQNQLSLFSFFSMAEGDKVNLYVDMCRLEATA